MIGAMTWHGRRGPVILGPTEHRVARYLADLTRAGRITLRTVELAERLGLERSEAYRITARLRVLGLFGVENDRAGTKGGRRYWRTPLEHDGQMLDEARHRTAWSRIVGWARRRRDLLHDRLAALRASVAGDGSRASNASRSPATHHLRHVDGTPRVGLPTAAGESPGSSPTLPAAGTFSERMRRYGLGPLMDEWARPRIAR